MTIQSNPELHNLFGYVETALADPNQEIQNLLGYVEWIGTPSLIALAKDATLAALTGYVETAYADPQQEIHTLDGYIEYAYFDPNQEMHNVFGYVEWIGTPSPIALAKDATLAAVTGYVEFYLNEPISLPNLQMYVFIF